MAKRYQGPRKEYETGGSIGSSEYLYTFKAQFRKHCYVRQEEGVNKTIRETILEEV
jgi:hypothetical protein